MPIVTVGEGSLFLISAEVSVIITRSRNKLSESFLAPSPRR